MIEAEYSGLGKLEVVVPSRESKILWEIEIKNFGNVRGEKWFKYGYVKTGFQSYRRRCFQCYGICRVFY